ncbi:MAG: CehA/McbA family metallohydrolase [Phycisphaerae bacterium]
MERIDGPSSPLFEPMALKGNIELSALAKAGVSEGMTRNIAHAATGDCVAWGIPFRIGKVVLLRDKPVEVKVRPTRAKWLVFLHTSDVIKLQKNEDGFISPMRGTGRLGEHAADYVIIYADGSERRLPIRRRREIGSLNRHWGENSFDALPDAKPHTVMGGPDTAIPHGLWARYKVQAWGDDLRPWVNWLWAWENPEPRKAIVAIRFEPVLGPLVVSAVAAGNAGSHPLRWRMRRKAILTLPAGKEFDPALAMRRLERQTHRLPPEKTGSKLTEADLLNQIHLDLGQVISATPRPLYPNKDWARSYNNRLPKVLPREVLVEYASHEDALFHLPGGKTIPVARLEAEGKAGSIQVVAPADQSVELRVVEKSSGKEVPVKLHVHGQAGEYLPPIDRHRLPNPQWFEDYSVDFSHQGRHHCTYIPGRTRLNLPVGRVFVEVSKGFEIRPVRKVFPVTRKTREIVIELERVLPWRENGWVTADTHVHFLTPHSALLEGAGEGVNIVNLLATQWGELFTNVGDIDTQTLLGDRELGDGGEHLVRVGTENRQHVLGHISLLGYNGGVIAPMTTGGPDESAIGDPIEVLLTEWARQCRKQNGVVVLPHSPNPRAEAACAIVSGAIDAVEMTSWGDLYSGIDPYSLSDWYRYLNCGYMVGAVGGTDKMAATTAVGTVRTYARLKPGRPFTYAAWKDAIRRAETFVTYGPLMEFAVEGRPMGWRIQMPSGGGRVDVTWKVASVTVPMSRVDLIVNGEIRASRRVKPDADEGSFSVKVGRSSWVALLVRGHYADRPEIVAAHSSPVMAAVKGTEFYAAADALTILEQIEGALAYLDTIGTRAEDAAYKRMRLVLTAAHRSVHNRMHRQGQFHKHTPVDDHPEHHAG